MSLREFQEIKMPRVINTASQEREHGENNPSNYDPGLPSTPTVDILPDKFDDIVSRLSELHSECQRLRRQNRRLRHESQRCKKKLQTSDQELEGVKMENQGLKCEIEWLRNQLLRNSNTYDDDENETGGGKDAVPSSSARNADVDSTTHSESDLTSSEGDEFSIHGIYEHISPRPPRVFITCTKNKRAQGKSIQVVDSIDNDQGATSVHNTTNPPSSQDHNPSCEMRKPHSYSSSQPCIATRISSPTHNENNAISHKSEEQQGNEASTLLDRCLGMFLADEVTNGATTTTSTKSPPQSPHSSTEGILSSTAGGSQPPPPPRASPVSLKGRSRVILLPKRLSLP